MQYTQVFLCINLWLIEAVTKWFIVVHSGSTGMNISTSKPSAIFA